MKKKIILITLFLIFISILFCQIPDLENKQAQKAQNLKIIPNYKFDNFMIVTIPNTLKKIAENRSKYFSNKDSN